MARLVRIQPVDVTLHAVVRGNNRNDIFATEGDRAQLHRCLVDASRRYELEVHAYVFMTNHVHLLATPRAAFAASRTLQAVGRKYVAYFNKVHGRTGTLWEGRFRSSPVANDRHLMACYRYIEMNPIRAGMVSRPDTFLWSSHRHNLGEIQDDLVSPHSLYVALSSSERGRLRAYRSLFEAPANDALVERLRDCLNNGWAFGDDAWCDDLEALAGRRVRRIKESRAPAIEFAERSRGEHSDPSRNQDAGQGTARSWELG